MSNADKAARAIRLFERLRTEIETAHKLYAGFRVQSKDGLKRAKYEQATKDKEADLYAIAYALDVLRASD